MLLCSVFMYVLLSLWWSGKGVLWILKTTFLLCKTGERVHEVATLRFKCKTSILKPWDTNAGLVATCASIVLKTDNIDTDELAASSSLPPLFLLRPLNIEGRKTKLPNNIKKSYLLSNSLTTSIAYCQRRDTLSSLYPINKIHDSSSNILPSYTCLLTHTLLENHLIFNLLSRWDNLTEISPNALHIYWYWINWMFP